MDNLNHKYHHNHNNQHQNPPIFLSLVVLSTVVIIPTRYEVGLHRPIFVYAAASTSPDPSASSTVTASSSTNRFSTSSGRKNYNAVFSASDNKSSVRDIGVSATGGGSSYPWSKESSAGEGDGDGERENENRDDEEEQANMGFAEGMKISQGSTTKTVEGGATSSVVATSAAAYTDVAATVDHGNGPSDSYSEVEIETLAASDTGDNTERYVRSGERSGATTPKEEGIVVNDESSSPGASSRPLRTLTKLQAMLDETDYVTTSAKLLSEDGKEYVAVISDGETDQNEDVVDVSASASSASSAVARGSLGRSTKDDETNEKLWTSKDRSKYRRQQRRQKEQQQKLREDIEMHKLGQHLRLDERERFHHEPHQLHLSSVNSSDDDEALAVGDVDGTDFTDDGLGYTLPNLPVYISDGEASEFDPLPSVPTKEKQRHKQQTQQLQQHQQKLRSSQPQQMHRSFPQPQHVQQHQQEQQGHGYNMKHVPYPNNYPYGSSNYALQPTQNGQGHHQSPSQPQSQPQPQSQQQSPPPTYPYQGYFHPFPLQGASSTPYHPSHPQMPPPPPPPLHPYGMASNPHYAAQYAGWVAAAAAASAASGGAHPYAHAQQVPPGSQQQQQQAALHVHSNEHHPQQQQQHHLPPSHQQQGQQYQYNGPPKLTGTLNAASASPAFRTEQKKKTRTGGVARSKARVISNNPADDPIRSTPSPATMKTTTTMRTKYGVTEGKKNQKNERPLSKSRGATRDSFQRRTTAKTPKQRDVTQPSYEQHDTTTAAGVPPPVAVLAPPYVPNYWPGEPTALTSQGATTTTMMQPSPYQEKMTSLALAGTNLSFDSIQKILFSLMGIVMLSYCAVSPRTLAPIEYNVKFKRNLQIVALVAFVPTVIFLSIFDGKDVHNDVNSNVHTFYTSFTMGYIVTFVLELIFTTALRLGVFALWEPEVFRLTPDVPLPILPWVLRDNKYRPKRITLFTADFVTSCVASSVIEEFIKLKVVQWTVRLPRNFCLIKKKKSAFPSGGKKNKNTNKHRKRTKTITVMEPIPAQAVTNVNSYVTHMLASSIGLKFADSIRRALMYTKDYNANKGFYALCRGIFPIQELCGTLTALQLAKRDVLGVNLPMWKILFPAVFIHGMANFRGMKPIFKWNSSTPWSEMQMSPLNLADDSTFFEILSKGFAKLVWLSVLARVLGSCIKNYYMIGRQSMKRITTYATNHAAFAAELEADELLKKNKSEG